MPTDNLNIEALLDFSNQQDDLIKGHQKEMLQVLRNKEQLRAALALEHAQKSAFSTEDVTEFEEVPVYCRYLDPESIRRTGIWTPAQVQQKLEEASEKDAKEFVAFLRDFERKGYLCFHGESKRKIFQTLRQQLPMMRNYSEANFYAYF